jgi:beta-lactamase superfamily II metal-dependent hydrolase
MFPMVVLCLASVVRSISVLNVGDGACSVLRERCREDDFSGRTAIIDCGTNRRRAQSAADSLARHLSAGDWPSLSELVVTHFDYDHWEGLVRIVDSAPPGLSGVSPDLRIFFPAVPFGVNLQLPSKVVTFITITGPFGVQALDLRAAWRRLTRVQLVPLARGDGFSLAGRVHEVVWPPEWLDGPITRRLNEVVHQIDDFAGRLAEAGFPRLLESLQVYQHSPHDRRPVRYGRTAGDLSDLPHLELEGEGAYEEPEDLPIEDRSDAAIPANIVHDPEFKKLYRAARRAQNDLSLVFHDRERASLLVFGDAPPYVIENVRKDLNADGYDVALAPHHGSQELVNGAPPAETCVSQGGQWMRQYWHYHKNSHDNRSGKCLHTHDSGYILRRLR